SGAICGLLGAIAVWFFLNRVYMPPEVASRGLRSIMVNALLVVGISLMPGISWGGHLGGAITGAAAAVLLNYQRHGNRIVRWLAVAALPLVPVASVAAMLHTLNGNPLWQQVRAEMQQRETSEAARELKDRYRREALDVDEEARSAYNRAYNAVLQMNPSRRD